MSTAIIITHPITGEPTSLPALSREYGIAPDTLRYRYYDMGKRGPDLIAPPTGEHYRRTRAINRADRARRFQRELNEWLASPAGRLSTHLFRDFRRGAA